MGAHEAPASILAAIETQAIRHHAARLVAEWDALVADHDQDLHAWRMALCRWAGHASAVLEELARG